ncbi:MAG TPA: hypothetical protein GXX20_12605 [Clostridiaceae bacterium]|nr:hypothetical protein [Clostridiaceae bacterium]
MTIHVMDRRASDNKYLHRDFHISADIGIAYVGEKYGDNGVKEYLRKFASAYYAPLVDDIKKRGLIALKEHIEKIYEAEEYSEHLKIEMSKNQLIVDVDSCPGVTYMKKQGHIPSKWYIEATRTVNETIADLADISFELLFYNEENGSAKYRFFTRR